MQVVPGAVWGQSGLPPPAGCLVIAGKTHLHNLQKWLITSPEESLSRCSTTNNLKQIFEALSVLAVQF